MDILIHTLSGALVGSLVGNLAKDKTIGQRFLLVVVGAIAGAMPDLDAISMWSGFDASFGSWFSLSETGRQIFYGKHWYSHHGCSHSLLAALIITAVFAVIRKVIVRKSIGQGLVYCLAFFFGYVSHLLGDLPTPPGSWGGIGLFYPLDEYAGGWAWTWWWNNYDVFLLLLAGVIVNLILIVLRRFLKQWSGKSSVISSCAIIVLCLVQFHLRGPNFEYVRGNNEFGSMEQRSLAIQRKVLGESLFKQMRKFDNSISLNF
jgi:inner membrane protein